jgi:hypothetical protein
VGCLPVRAVDYSPALGEVYSLVQEVGYLLDQAGASSLAQEADLSLARVGDFSPAPARTLITAIGRHVRYFGNI